MKLNKLGMSRQQTNPLNRTMGTGGANLLGEASIPSVKSSTGFDHNKMAAVDPIVSSEMLYNHRKHSGLRNHPGAVSATLNGLMDLISVGEVNRINDILDDCTREELDRCTESYVQSLVHLSLTIMKKVKASKHYET